MKTMKPTTTLAVVLVLAVPALAEDKVTTDAGTIDAAKTKKFFKEDTYSP